MNCGGNIKGVIFDLGRVLLDFDHMTAAQRLSSFTDKSGKEIYELFFDSPVTGLFEEGRVSAQEFFLKVKETLNLKITYETFVPIWNEIFYFTRENLRVYNIALSLKEGYRVALLTNINTLHLEHIKKAFPVFDAFHSVLASCELGARKPHRDVYLTALEALGTLPEETFYTDDRPELILGARGLGIKAEVFTGSVKLKQDLLKAGIMNLPQ